MRLVKWEQRARACLKPLRRLLPPDPPRFFAPIASRSRPLETLPPDRHREGLQAAARRGRQDEAKASLVARAGSEDAGRDAPENRVLLGVQENSVVRIVECPLAVVKKPCVSEVGLMSSSVGEMGPRRQAASRRTDMRASQMHTLRCDRPRPLRLEGGAALDWVKQDRRDSRSPWTRDHPRRRSRRRPGRPPAGARCCAGARALPMRRASESTVWRQGRRFRDGCTSRRHLAVILPRRA